MKQRVATFVILVLCACSLAQADQPPLVAEFALPHLPTAAAVGTEGTVLNPAALHVNKPISVHFYHSFAEGSLSGDNAFFISTSGLGFGYQRFGLGYPAGVSRYDFVVSSKVVRDLYTGFSYTYYKTDWRPLDKAHSWNYSLLWHLNRSLALSAQLQNLSRSRFGGERSAIGYCLGAAVRPLDERLTVGGDIRLYGGQSLSQAEWSVTGRAYLKEGLAVFAGFEDQQRFGIGFELQFGHSAVGGESFFGDGGYQRSTVYTILSASTRDRVYRGQGKILAVDLAGEIPEQRGRFLPFWVQRETLYQKLKKIAAAKHDPAIKGLLLNVKNPRIGWGKIADFRATIKDFASTGKPVVCYLGTFSGTGSYYLASSADSIFMVPVDALYLTGIRAEVMFYAGTLEKLAIEPEIEKVGEYKTAPNRYTETSLTPEHREALGDLLDDFYSEVVSGIAAGRGFQEQELRELIDQGPFTSIQAESLGLVDGRFYPTELTERMESLFGAGLPLLPSTGYLNRETFRERFGAIPKVALVTVVGDLVRGPSGSSIIQGRTAGSATVASAIRRCADAADVKAIVMRLDTPGGDAVASDLIWGELSRAAAAKPVVISVSDVCASGGYYVATAADRILVEPTSVTGSIGIYAGKANLAGFYDKLGLSTEILTRGEHAAMFSRGSSFSQDERRILRRQLTDLYGRFVDLVAESRGLTADSVEAIARGRVWSGSRAIELGLADRKGSLLDAIEDAAVLADLRPGDYEVLEVAPGGGWFSIPELVSLGLSSLTPSGALSATAGELLPLAEGQEGAPQYRLPYELKVK